MDKGAEVYRNLLAYLKNARAQMEVANHDEKLVLISEIYQRCKADALILFKYGKKTYYYTHICDLILICEEYLESTYILNYSETVVNPGDLKHFESVDEFLNYIVYQVRKKILAEFMRARGYYEDLKSIGLTNTCEILSTWVLEECQKLGIKCKKVRIDPGFNRRKLLYDGMGFHYFNLATINGKTYLLDLSYKQFFKQKNNLIERLGVAGLVGCAPGVYMMVDEARSKLASDLIENGWIEFNSDNIKNYFDGFALSVRNGIYYELLGKIDYSTNYTSVDYLNFLSGKDDMFKHEPREGLGRQLKPLKNPNIKFNLK